MAKKVADPQEPKKDFVYVRDHKRSMRQIASSTYNPKNEKKAKPKEDEGEDVVDALKPETPEEEAAPQKREEEPEKPVELEKPAIDPIKVAEDAADKAAAKAAEKFRDELKTIQDSELSKVEKKKAEDELMAVWDREGRLPGDYKEIFNEAQRIGELKAKHFYEEQRVKEREEKLKIDNDNRQAAAKAVDARTAYEEELQRRVGAEINELRQAKYLDEESEKDFLQYGIELNTTRVKEGKEPISDVTKLYFMHYQPHKKAAPKKDAQPAGADAPIAGAKTSHTSELPTDKYVYSRDHKRSFRQILQDGLKRAQGK